MTFAQKLLVGMMAPFAIVLLAVGLKGTLDMIDEIRACSCAEPPPVTVMCYCDGNNVSCGCQWEEGLCAEGWEGEWE